MLTEAISFIIESEKLKQILRRSNPVGLSRPENSAEHSWSAALAASVLIPELAPHLDQLRVIRMLLIHDLVEIDAGDTFCYGDQTGKDEREQAAARRIFAILPDETEKEFHQLWREFEDKESEESRLANAIDRLLPLLQNSGNGGGSWAENKVTFDQVYQRNKEIAHASPELWSDTEKLIIAAKDRGLLRLHDQILPDPYSSSPSPTPVTDPISSSASQTTGALPTPPFMATIPSCKPPPLTASRGKAPSSTTPTFPRPPALPTGTH